MSSDLTLLPKKYIIAAENAADMARGITLGYFRQNTQARQKSDLSPVTIADQRCDEQIKQMILARFPHHGFLGEETGFQSADSDWLWVVDPIDGTKSYASGIPTFGFLIALIHRNKPVLGLIDHPALDERWLGIAGQSTLYNGSVCHTNQTNRLSQAIVHATTPDMFTAHEADNFKALTDQCMYRTYGGDCYLYGMLACGHTSIVCESDLKFYDYAALIPVVEGAGGCITDWQGNPLTSDLSVDHSESNHSAVGHSPSSRATSGQVLATANAKLHRLAIAQLNR